MECGVQPGLGAVDQCPLAAKGHLSGESERLLLPRTPSAQNRGLAWRGGHGRAPHLRSGRSSMAEVAGEAGAAGAVA